MKHVERVYLSTLCLQHIPSSLAAKKISKFQKIPQKRDTLIFTPGFALDARKLRFA